MDHSGQGTQSGPEASTSQLESLSLQGTQPIPSGSPPKQFQVQEEEDFGEFSSFNSSKANELKPSSSNLDHDEADITPKAPYRDWSSKEQYDSDEESLDDPTQGAARPGARDATGSTLTHNSTAEGDADLLISGGPKRDPLLASDPSVDDSAKPTVVFAIPFPEAPFGVKGDIPPFCVYTPPARRLEKPQEGQKEGILTMAQRKWQEQQQAAKTGPQNFRNKAMGYVSTAISWTKNSKVEFLTRTPGKGKLSELRILYPPTMPAEDLQSKFTALLKAVKAAAIRNGVISTAILPLVFVFDTLTFIPGPFEVNTAWAVASWTGAARASSITNSLTNETVPISFHPTPLLESLQFRLAELCKSQAKPDTPTCAPKWEGTEEPMRGIELAAVTLAAVTTHIGLEAHEIFETDLEALLEDIEQVLTKGANEWLSIVQAHS